MPRHLALKGGPTSSRGRRRRSVTIRLPVAMSSTCSACRQRTPAGRRGAVGDLWSRVQHQSSTRPTCAPRTHALEAHGIRPTKSAIHVRESPSGFGPPIVVDRWGFLRTHDGVVRRRFHRSARPPGANRSTLDGGGGPRSGRRPLGPSVTRVRVVEIGLRTVTGGHLRFARRANRMLR